jgi:hypothetical protein
MVDLLEATEEGIVWLTLNRSDRLNAFSLAMLLGLGKRSTGWAATVTSGRSSLRVRDAAFAPAAMSRRWRAGPPRGLKSVSRGYGECISSRCC